MHRGKIGRYFHISVAFYSRYPFVSSWNHTRLHDLLIFIVMLVSIYYYESLHSIQRQSWVDCIPIETPQITRVHWTGPDSWYSVFSWRLPLCSGERRRRRKGAGSWCGCCHEAGVRTQQLTSSARRRLGTSGRIIWTICTILYDPAAIFIFWVVFGRFLLLSPIFPSDFED